MMDNVSILIKPASSQCNMECGYCFYKCESRLREDYSKGFMTEDTLKQLVINAFDNSGKSVHFAFQGGEPMLAGLGFYNRFAKFLKEYNVKGLSISNTIQTNGLLINEEWADFFAQNDFLLGVSLDGPAEIHNRYRRAAGKEDSFDRVFESIGILSDKNVPFNILSVITEEASHNAKALYSFYKENHIEYIQLIPCMNYGEMSASVSAESYGRFLCDFFDLWYDDFMNGMDMDIRFFSNLAQMTVGFMPEECGMCGKCTCYFVVEADGSVYPCDFNCLDEWKLGTIQQPFSELSASEKADRFLRRSYRIPKECSKCEYYRLCRNGCYIWRANNTGINRLCSSYRMFYSHAWKRLYALGGLIAGKLGIQMI